MTAQAELVILDEQRYGASQVVDSGSSLLAIFGYDHLHDLEDYFWGILPEDVGDLYLNDETDSINIRGGEIQMWGLAYPFTIAELDFYLFEFHERSTIQGLFWDLPDAHSTDENEQPRILLWLAEFFRTTPEAFVTTLGDQWLYLDHDPDGFDGNSTYYLWTGSAIIALNNVNIYLYRCAAGSIPDDVGLVSETCELVRSKYDIWDDGGPTLDWLAPFVLDTAGADEQHIIEFDMGGSP